MTITSKVGQTIILCWRDNMKYFTISYFTHYITDCDVVYAYYSQEVAILADAMADVGFLENSLTSKLGKQIISPAYIIQQIGSIPKCLEKNMTKKLCENNSMLRLGEKNNNLTADDLLPAPLSEIK